MSYEEIARELEAFSHRNPDERIYFVDSHSADGTPHSTAIYIVPVLWMVAVNPLREIYIGTYEGSACRLVDRQRLAFEIVARQTLRERLEKAVLDCRTLWSQARRLSAGKTRVTPKPFDLGDQICFSEVT